MKTNHLHITNGNFLTINYYQYFRNAACPEARRMPKAILSICQPLGAVFPSVRRSVAKDCANRIYTRVAPWRNQWTAEGKMRRVFAW
jgi:hypothetical protein